MVSSLADLSAGWRTALTGAKIHNAEISIPLHWEENQEEFRRLREIRNAGELEILSIHLPFAPFEELDIISTDESRRRIAAEKIAETIRLCAPLRPEAFTLHSGGEPNSPEERRAKIAAMRNTVRQLLPGIRAAGSVLNIELLPRTCIGNVPAELLEIVNGFPPDSVGICFDVNHLMEKYTQIPELIREAAPRIHAFHLSDYDGINECHWNPGEGLIDWPAVMSEIRRLPQKCLLILETAYAKPPWIFPPYPLKPELMFRRAEHNAFFLEHVRELSERFANFEIG